MYQLGLRVGEVHALNLANLDFENSKINVLGKGQKPHTLHMNDELIEILINGLNPRANPGPCSAASCGESDPNEIELFFCHY